MYTSSVESVIRRISFVIPARNEKEYIADCIQSITKQDIPLPYDIIVVDNASSDQTATIARSLGATVVFEKTEGLSYARQKGYQEATGDILVYMDADTRLTKHAIQEIIKRFQTDDNLVALSPSSTYFDADVVFNMFFISVQRIFWPIIRIVYVLLRKPEILIGNLIAIRMTALTYIGGINTEYQFYGEDTAIAYRLYTQGTVRYCPNITVTTSSRRFKSLGFFRTSWRYLYFYLLIVFGRDESAIKLSQKHKKESEASQKNSS